MTKGFSHIWVDLLTDVPQPVRLRSHVLAIFG